MDKKIAVIGAGPAGATAAYELAKNGVYVELFEAAPVVGGMAKSFKLWEQIVDVGPHRFFSSDPRVNKIWLEVVGKDYKLVDRLTRIYYKGKLYYYPLKAFDALSKLGLWEASRCVVSYMVEKTKKHEENPDNFEDWVTKRFGRRLFEIFFKTYSEKLWGIPCDNLDADFAAQRIKKFSLSEAIKKAFNLSKNEHKTLVEKFAYPLQGTGMVYERMAKKVEEFGGKVFLKTPVKEVLKQGNKVVGLKLANGEERHYDHVISSMPLTLLIKGLKDVPQNIIDLINKLRFRNTIIVYLHLDAKDIFPDNWLYVHAPELKTGRITNFRNWVPELYGDKQTTIVAMEYWSFDEEELWQTEDKKLIELATKEFSNLPFGKNVPVLDGHVYRVHRCYPVYERGYRKILKPVQEYLDSLENLTAIGRYGTFKYNNQDHSILMGLLAAENILYNKNHNLWEINTDYEYQEKAYITETGLTVVS